MSSVVHILQAWEASVSAFVTKIEWGEFCAVIKLFFKKWTAGLIKAELGASCALSPMTVYFWIYEIKRGRTLTQCEALSFAELSSRLRTSWKNERLCCGFTAE